MCTSSLAWPAPQRTRRLARRSGGASDAARIRAGAMSAREHRASLAEVPAQARRRLPGRLLAAGAQAPPPLRSCKSPARLSASGSSGTRFFGPTAAAGHCDLPSASATHWHLIELGNGRGQQQAPAQGREGLGPTGSRGRSDPSCCAKVKRRTQSTRRLGACWRRGIGGARCGGSIRWDEFDCNGGT
jgi:hypothetical protein